MGIDSPFPYFAGKSRVAAEVWARFGAVDNYVEPFFGSGAVLLARPRSTWATPEDPGTETGESRWLASKPGCEKPEGTHPPARRFTEGE